MKATKLLMAALALTGCATVPADAARRTSAPQVRIADATASEDGVMNFTVTRSSSVGSSSVTFRTVDGSALAGSDYVAASGTASWGVGQTTTTIAITLIRSGAVEPTETFTVKLRAGTNAKLSDSSAIGKITDEADPLTPPVEDPEDPPAAPDPETKLCSDGSSIPVEDDCPVETPERDPLLGEIDIASNFSYLLAIQNISLQAKTAAPDVVGAFRFICGAGKLGYIDPIVNPGGVSSHLHQFYGNDSVTGSSTYATLRGAGVSTCNQDATGTYSVNRSAYWMPAMLDGRGNVVKPDHVIIYYKRRPISDPKCSLSSGDPKAEGNCVDLPNGLKFIFGYDMVTGNPATGSTYFNCKGTGAVPGTYANIPATIGKCVIGGQIGAIIKGPDCWDGKNLDSANHRDHMAYSGYGTWGYRKCPSTHPYVVPGFTLQAWYSIASGDDLSLWSLSSDAMHPTLPKGTTFHADFFMAWDPTVMDMWHDNCIDLLLNCSSGDLGNMKMLRGATTPIYNGVTTWKNPSRLVAVPTP